MLGSCFKRQIDKNKVDEEDEKIDEMTFAEYRDSSSIIRDKYDGIYPNPDSIETTMMLSMRTNEPVQYVVHETNWSGIFDEKLLANNSNCRFRPKSKKKVQRGMDAWTVEIFSPAECNKLIELCEMYGFEDAGYPKGYRSNTRMITNDPVFMQELYARIKQCCPATYKDDGIEWKICGLNERFRWCKYVKGQLFGMHCDTRFVRNDKEKSFYTVNVYLNDGKKDFGGGRTCFFDNKGIGNKKKMTKGVVATPGLALMVFVCVSVCHLLLMRICFRVYSSISIQIRFGMMVSWCLGESNI